MTEQKQQAFKDSADRELVRSDLRSNFLLEAGAGSGKTSAMAGRFAALVSSGQCDISEIVAITFTRKAANELKERVRHELVKAGSPHSAELHRCFIGTIHAFCSKLLRERPIEAGVDPEFIELDEGQDKAIRETVWEEYVMNADASRRVILARMEIFGLDQDVLKSFLGKVCDNPDLEFQLPGEKRFDEKEFSKVVNEVFRALTSLVRSVAEEMPKPGTTKEDRKDALQNSITVFLRRTSRKALSLSDKLALLKDFNTPSRIKVTQKCWSDEKEGKQRAKEIEEEFAVFRDESTAAIFELKSEYGYNSVAVPFVMTARKIYLDRKKSLAVLNFQDLLQGATTLLRDHPEVRTYFQHKYKAILVDEFQDTDPVQARMLMCLSGKDPFEKEWQAASPLPGSLFVVGDPKQSIYGFRRADIDIYNQFKAIMTKAGGKRAALTTNFRSVKELEAWYNGVFPGLLSAKSPLAVQAEFSRMDTVTNSLPGTLGGVYKYKVDREKVAEVIQSDSAHISRIIRYLTSGRLITVPGSEPGTYKARPIQYRDIMILYMKKAALTTHAKALSEVGISVKVVGADVVKRTPEFMGFADVVRMLAYPEENALLYKVLRGPSFGFTDEELFRYHEAGGHFNIYADIAALKRSHSAREDQAKAAATLALLDRLSKAFVLLKGFAYYMKKMVPSAAAERIIEELGFTARMLYSGYKLGELGSFYSLIERVRMQKLTNVWDLNQFIEEISTMIEAGYEEDLELEGENYNAVRMMNLHKAKGLEAPVVILAAPCSGKTMQPDFYVDRSKEMEPGGKLYGIACLRLGRYNSKDTVQPSAWEGVRPTALARDLAERDRLLYVAATRARNMLIISDSAAKSSPWAPLLKAETEDQQRARDLVQHLGRIILEAGFEDANTGSNTARDTTDPNKHQTANAGTLGEILGRTKTAFNTLGATYQTYTPSEKKKRKDKDEVSSLPETDPDQILGNSMEIFMEGDQEVLKTIRTDLGTAVHKVFEGLIKGDKDLEVMIPFIALQIGQKEITEKLLHSIAAQFQTSSLWHRIQASKTVYTEVPLSIKVPAGSSFGGTEFDQDCYVSGAIDLVFLEDSGWTIIDYKTCAKTEVKSELTKLYQSQLDAYKEAWELATGEKVGKTEIFFVEKG